MKAYPVVSLNGREGLREKQAQTSSPWVFSALNLGLVLEPESSRQTWNNRSLNQRQINFWNVTGF